MPQVFSRRSELWVKLGFAAFFLGMAAFLFSLLWPARADDEIHDALAQPIPFSHKHHVGDVGLDCRYCHTTVETRPFAGLPSTQVCLSCHSQLFTDAPMLAPLRESAATGQPIAWARVHRLPDFVYFDHSIHVAKGVACMECHGRVDQMPLTARVASLEMQWCVACHRDPTPHLRPHDQVFTMGAPPLSEHEAAMLAKALKLESTGRLTDCSTCHR
ncbi:MAG: cytochrome [Rhizobacter sp.]|nr:cytochrome [Rhizobacter sp.]